MEPLTPLPLDLFKEVIAYFDDFAEGTLQCFTDWFSCGSKGAEDFEKNVLPKLQQRRVGDDDELFAGTSHCGGFYGMLCGPDAVNGVLAQFYRAGFSFYPRTVARIAYNGGALAAWLARDFYLDLQKPLLELKQQGWYMDSNGKRFFDTVFQNVKTYINTHKQKQTRKRKNPVVIWLE